MLLESFDGIYPKHASYKPTLRIINKLDGSSEEILRMRTINGTKILLE
ncbi:MAG: hypothetical protein WA631_10855 [Nitrososphaeraceae archaeon]